jgi:hypothetical protein
MDIPALYTRQVYTSAFYSCKNNKLLQQPA